MTNEELVAANEALATLLKESLTALEKVTEERDAALASSEALAHQLAHNKPNMKPDERVYVSCMSESDLYNIWHDLSDDYKPYYQDNGPSNPKHRWQFEIWDWNVKSHVIAFGPTKESLMEREEEFLRAYYEGMYSLWRYMENRVWCD